MGVVTVFLSGVLLSGVLLSGVLLSGVLLSGVLTFGIIQLVPYGRAHSNPPVTGEPKWPTPETRQLMVDSCFACHSNEVESARQQSNSS